MIVTSFIVFKKKNIKISNKEQHNEEKKKIKIKEKCNILKFNRHSNTYGLFFI